MGVRTERLNETRPRLATWPPEIQYYGYAGPKRHRPPKCMNLEYANAYFTTQHSTSVH